MTKLNAIQRLLQRDRDHAAARADFLTKADARHHHSPPQRRQAAL
ncbi:MULTISPECIES: hypothetical protein [unclassified Bradyrhizobium]|nr:MULTISPECIES: hypothetical protein [unclassified Bradyrhizobium]